MRLQNRRQHTEILSAARESRIREKRRPARQADLQPISLTLTNRLEKGRLLDFQKGFKILRSHVRE